MHRPTFVYVRLGDASKKKQPSGDCRVGEHSVSEHPTGTNALTLGYYDNVTALNRIGALSRPYQVRPSVPT
eukprot:6199657-Pleurochrysis_carterae.AAC.2